MPNLLEICIFKLKFYPRDITLDGRTWRLLADIIGVRKDIGEAHSGLSSKRGWLNGIVNRVPVFPVFASLLHSLGKFFRPTAGTTEDSLSLVLGAATDAAHILLPLASLKASCDVVATCFWEVLSLFSTRDIQEKELLFSLNLCEIVVSTFESSFGNHSNKKKVCGDEAGVPKQEAYAGFVDRHAPCGETSIFLAACDREGPTSPFRGGGSDWVSWATLRRWMLCCIFS